MSDHRKPDLNQLRVAILPDLIISIIGPVLIYRLAAPYMSATNALLLAGVLPIIRIGFSLVRLHRLNLLGVFSLLAIVVKILVALVFKDARLVLVSASLITAVYGILMLASLFASSSLIVKFIESFLSNASAQNRQFMQRLQEANILAAFRVVTAVWGAGLLLECVVQMTLVYSLSIDQFLIVSPFIRYGFLGVLILWALLFRMIRLRMLRRRNLQKEDSDASNTTDTALMMQTNEKGQVR